MKKAVYLDNHSGTRIDPRVYEEMLPYLDTCYGNPQSMHSLAAKSKDALDTARAQTAALIGASEKEIYFTSCGSESNNLAVKGAAQAVKKGRHMIVSSIEHFSVLYSARRLEQAGFEVTYLPVDRYGIIDPEDLRKSLREDTSLVSIQHANPEIGTVQHLRELAGIARSKGALFHTDAVCTAGTIPVDVNELGADLLTLSSSAFYGPRGAAALYIRGGTRIIPQVDGGVQENGKRAGTENIPGIVGLGKASEIALKEMEKNGLVMKELRDRIIRELPEKIAHVYLNGHPEKRLPNNINFSIEFIEGEGMMLLLDQKGIFVSSGSACASKALKMSHVLSATGVDPSVGQGSILMTLSKYNIPAEIDHLIENFPPVVKRLREMSPLYEHFRKTGKRMAAGPGTDYSHGHEEEED